MAKSFVVRRKNLQKKEDKFVTMTIRIDKALQEEYNNLAEKSDYSRNELICMALRYALDNLEFISDSENDK